MTTAYIFATTSNCSSLVLIVYLYARKVSCTLCFSPKLIFGDLTTQFPNKVVFFICSGLSVKIVDTAYSTGILQMIGELHTPTILLHPLSIVKINLVQARIKGFINLLIRGSNCLRICSTETLRCMRHLRASQPQRQQCLWQQSSLLLNCPVNPFHNARDSLSFG